MMKKASIKNIFKKDKSPRTPTEEVWGELCTSKTTPQEYTPSSTSRLSCKKSPRSPKRQLSPSQNDGNSSRKLDVSNSSREGIKNRRVSESNVQRISSSKQSNGFRSASEHNLPRSSSQRISSRTSTSSRNMSRHSTTSTNKRFPFENYISPSAVDVDAPIEDYAGPIDCDEVSVSSSASAAESIQNLTGADDEDRVDATTKKELSPKRQDSPDTIPVVYEDCYESDSWSANNLRSGQPDDASNIIVGKHPLTMKYTNDETMNVQEEEDDTTVYSFKAVRSEEESIMAPMSIDEIDDKDAGFGRMETDESALDDEDYYRQDYFSMMTKSKRLMYQDSESITEEEGAGASLSERVLMSEENGDGAGKRLSLVELAVMTEPDVPVGRVEDNDDEGVDYGNLYNDASFPLASGEEEDGASVVSDVVGAVKNDNSFDSETEKLAVMTEPGLPVGMMADNDEGVDYGNLYTDTSFPLAGSEELDGDGASVVPDEVGTVENGSTCDSETVDPVNGHDETERDVKETDHVADPQDRSESATIAPLLPDDSEFAEETCSAAALEENAASSEVDVLTSDPLLIEEAEEEKSDGSQASYDIGNVVVEEECSTADNKQELAAVQSEASQSGDSINDNLDESKAPNEIASEPIDVHPLLVALNSDADDREQELVEPAVSNELNQESDVLDQPESISEADAVECNVLDNSIESAFSTNELAMTAGVQGVGEKNLEDQVLSSFDDTAIAGSAEACKNEVTLDQIIDESGLVVHSSCKESMRSMAIESENTGTIQEENSPIAGVKNLFKRVGLFVRKSSMTPLEEEIENLSPVTKTNLPDHDVESQSAQFHCNNSELNALPSDTSEREDNQLIQYARSRSLSPAPRAKPSIEKPFAIERTQSLPVSPVRWHPFPMSSPNMASRQSSNNHFAVSIDSNSDVEFSEAIAAQEHAVTPMLPLANKALAEPSSDTTIDINRIIRENQRLRCKRQQLCDSLASMAMQCQIHEKASSEKIFSLEQKLRALTAEKDNYVTVNRAGRYDAETVRRLSVGVVEQNALLETKDRQISQLTLKLQVLQQTLDKLEESHHAAKLHWEEERMRFHDCLTSSEQKSLYALNQELFETRAHLNAALSDIDALTSALESNNEALDSTVEELEALREFKARHSNGEKVDARVTISRSVPTLALQQRNLETSKLQRDLEEGLQELKKLHELVVTSDGKNFRDLEAEIKLLRGEANASRLEAKLANQRVEQLSAEVKDKSAEVAKMQHDLDTRAATSSKKATDDIESEEVKPSSDLDYWSKDLKDFSLVSDLEEKIVELERKLASYENPTAVEKEAVAEKSKDSDADTLNRNSPTTIPSDNQNQTSETPNSKESPSKRAPPESPLTARKLFQPLRRGWANASPLIKNPLVDTVDRDDFTNEKDISKLTDILKANTEVMNKLKQDILKVQTEKEDAELAMTSKINALQEENAAYASQVAVLEKAFREMNDKRASDGDDLTEDGSVVASVAAAAAEPLSPSVHSEKSDASYGHDSDLQAKNIMTLQRSINELEKLESTQSHQEDEIERLKSELVSLRVTSKQEKEAELEKLREEIAIVTAQRSALESQLIEINQSAGLLRDSLSDQHAQSPGKKADATDEPCSPRSTEDESNAGGNDPILVAQVVMLENANKVLEKNVNSLRSDLQSKLAPLLEKVAMLEEEKRMMEDEMNVKLECREMTIKNLEHSLQQLNASRFGSGKKKRESRLDSPSPTHGCLDLDI
ncbi:hypothetical protein ACHAXN_009420 [Cyclotella atomus]